jgi:aldehyde dehydrogenase (NAD+)
MSSSYPFWIAGQSASSDLTVDVLHPADSHVVASHYVPSLADVENAVSSAHAARLPMQRTSAAARAQALMHVSSRLQERFEEMSQIIVEEGGKPLMWARVEVTRAINTFRWAAEEARRSGGEIQRLDTEATTEGRMGLIRRFPRGVVLGIAPFNFPLNLIAHKVAPAIAVGAPIIIKPAPATPLCALILGEILAETDLPAGSWSVLPVDNANAQQLVLDPRLSVVSFTGSDKVGMHIQELVPHKHVTLELGGNAAAVVLSDWSSEGDLEWAATRIATFGHSQAGQSCISVQRVMIHADIYDDLTARIVSKTAALPNGDPHDAQVVVGPLINEAAAIRVESWIDEAVRGGAKVLTGGRRDGAFVEPTVITEVASSAQLVCGEVFGPVIVLSKFDTVAEAFAQVNDSDFGLQAGVFTHSLETAFSAHANLDVGGVIIGDVPAFRSDQMPYGGVKASGVGKEGVRFAMEDLTHERILVLSGIEI